MFPPLTDFFALLGINLVLCAGCLRLLGAAGGGLSGEARPWAKWTGVVLFVLLWVPVGAAQLPIVAYVRGISSDLSITLVVLACLGLGRRLLGLRAIGQRERNALFAVIAVAAMFLYPLALGWGDWDAYRLGWGALGMWAALLILSLVCWLRGLRLLPVLVAMALLAWTAGLLESSNLWDYLMDPWLSVAALVYCAKAAILKLLKLSGRGRPGAVS